MPHASGTHTTNQAAAIIAGEDLLVFSGICQFLSISIYAALSHMRSENRLLNALSIVPGVLLLAGIGYAAEILERSVNGYAKAHH
ncbi:MAG TPA: hypothetical protein VN901_27965 [Candidatus Acidoferrales bacterium]|nr:hypothetical protein [Candidatus Acidoferrales bacterium]